MAGTIRSVTVDDALAIQAIYAPYVAETIISFETILPTVEEMAARIQKTLVKYPWLVYESHERTNSEQNGASHRPTIAGYVYASLHRERAAYQWSVDVSVYVHPAYQRRHIGRGLYTALFDLLRAQGYVNAYAGISLPNPSSVGIHTALGFEPIGVYQKVGYKFGGWYDVGWWGLRLNEAVAKPAAPEAISNFIDTPLWSAALQHGQTLIRD